MPSASAHRRDRRPCRLPREAALAIPADRTPSRRPDRRRVARRRPRPTGRERARRRRGGVRSHGGHPRRGGSAGARRAWELALHRRAGERRDSGARGVAGRGRRRRGEPARRGGHARTGPLGPGRAPLALRSRHRYGIAARGEDLRGGRALRLRGGQAGSVRGARTRGDGRASERGSGSAGPRDASVRPDRAAFRLGAAPRASALRGRPTLRRVPSPPLRRRDDGQRRPLPCARGLGDGVLLDGGGRLLPDSRRARGGGATRGPGSGRAALPLRPRDVTSRGDLRVRGGRRLRGADGRGLEPARGGTGGPGAHRDQRRPGAAGVRAPSRVHERRGTLPRADPRAPRPRAGRCPPPRGALPRRRSDGLRERDVERHLLVEPWVGRARPPGVAAGSPPRPPAAPYGPGPRSGAKSGRRRTRPGCPRLRGLEQRTHGGVRRHGHDRRRGTLRRAGCASGGGRRVRRRQGVGHQGPRMGGQPRHGSHLTHRASTRR